MINKPIREASLDESPIFQESFAMHFIKNKKIIEKLLTFKEFKKERPPRILPSGFKDHTLGGRLIGFRECHLDGDSCLIYTDKNNIIKTIIVVTHDELEPGSAKEKALKKRIEKYL